MNTHYTAVRTPNRRDVELRGVHHVLTEWGDADADLVVYLHGWGDTGSSFQFVVDALPDDWRVVAPDWRGFGHSGRNLSSYWFPDYLADLDSLLQILSPDEPVRLIGHSMGANVAGLYAGAMPERISRLVNLEGFGLRDSQPEDAPGRYREWISRLREEPRFRRFRDIDALASHIRQRSPKLGEERARFVAECWSDADDGERVILADPKHKLPNPVLYRRAEAQACWHNISAPVLQVVGDRSPYMDWLGGDDGEPHVDLGVVNAETLVLKDIGHMLHFEAPEQVAEAIDRFLRL